MDTATLAQLAPVIEGKPDVKRITEIDLDGTGPEVPDAEDHL